MARITVHNGSEVLGDAVCSTESLTFAGFGQAVASHRIHKDMSVNGYSHVEFTKIPVMETVTRKVVKEDKIAAAPPTTGQQRRANQLDNLLDMRGFGNAVRNEQAQRETARQYTVTETVEQVSNKHVWHRHSLDVAEGHLVMIIATQAAQNGTKKAGYLLQANNRASEKKLSFISGDKEIVIACGNFNIVSQALLDENHAELNTCFHMSKTSGMVKFFEKKNDDRFFPLDISDKCGITVNNGSVIRVKDYAPTRVLDFD